MSQHRSLLALALVGSLAPMAIAQPDPDRFPPPSPEETRQVVAAFNDAVRRSEGPGSGDLFALPAKYNYMIETGNMTAATSDILVHGRPRKLSHLGTHHGTLWDYDARIPLVLHGPSYVKPGRYLAPATQQDIVPTLSSLLGITPAEDARGRALSEALVSAEKPPKAILVLVFDQGGTYLYDTHPTHFPYLRSLWNNGAQFLNARLTHVDPETIVGHTAIGTGAYPGRSGITANKPWVRSGGAAMMAVKRESNPSPMGIESPSLADVWLRHTHNNAIVISQSLADRAAIGMVGHGSWYEGNKKPLVAYYDEKAGRWTTNTSYYALPDYLGSMNPEASWQAFKGVWRGHDIEGPDAFRRSPAAAAFDGDAFLAMVEREPLGEDEVTDLLFWSLKATDFVGHRYGPDSLEAAETLRMQDSQAERVITALQKKVGADRLLVVHTADHGGAPLAELSGGIRLEDGTLLEAINRRFDRLDNGVPLAQHATSMQIYLNDAEMARNGVAVGAVRDFVKGYKVDGKPFFVEVIAARR